MGRLIGDLVRQRGWADADHLLEEKYPCTFAVFLVHQGIRRYEAGNFWLGIGEGIGIPLTPTQAWQWGQLFERIVTELPVVQFPPISRLRYVGPILLHGGIPDYCLADFFEHFIDPLVQRPEYASLSAEEFIRERLHHYTAAYLTDKPVIQFLESGGPAAIDFVERCREMAVRTAESGEIPLPEEVGLPPRVVEEYQAWREGRARPILHKQAIHQNPVLSLAPWGEGVFLHLPSQPVSATQSGLTALWIVLWNDRDREEVEGGIYREEAFQYPLADRGG